MFQVLVIEDQIKLLRNLQQLLEQDGYGVVVTGTGEEGYYAATTQTFDAIILDLTLPGRDGLQILSDLREAGFSKPVLILTARDSIDDRVAGLDSGADDYLVKPFTHAELLARVRALLRRGRSGVERLLHCGDIEMDLLTRRVIRRGVEIELSLREFELLEYLLRHKNSNVTRDMLARDVWKEPHGLLTNAIEVCVNGLRKKVELPGSRPLIVTVRGVGYSVRDRR
ncbi:MAG TPA: response regulator transcription factor [Planctomycetaceae bacterium]|nr:response regulator transcription factor [Planctomycetaceae bacterium]HQZ64732.1 response regulator transcription factor [Planctomycetaceae bacterium]